METKMGKTLEPRLGLLLLNLLFCCGQAHDAVLTFEPKWSTFYSGESVTLTCDMNEGEDSQWEYKLKKNNEIYLPYRPHKSRTLVLHSGEYQCCGRSRSSGQTKCSNTVTVSAADRPKAKLTAGSTTIPVGGSVTLSCSVKPSAGWKYRWLRRTSDSSLDKFITNNEENRVITVTQGGIYRCAGQRGNPAFISRQSHDVTIKTTFSNKVVATRRPNWPEMFSGESITLTCEIQGGETTDWTYEWRPTNRNSLPSSEYRISYITESDSGEYSCRGIGNYELTEWSDAVRLTVTSSRPQPVLSVSPSWPNPGASVTLSCEGLELQSAGWRFFWYKAVPNPNSTFYRAELLPDSINGTEQNSFIINGPTQTAGYQCRAGRGEPKFYTRYSKVKFIWSADPGPAASLSVNPDRVQHFRSDSVSLSCEGNFTEWRVRRFTETGRLSDFNCSIWGTMTGSTCTFELYYDKNGVYWCESKSGEFSNAVNITIQNDYYDGIILVSPVHPVTEGDPVTLSCRDKKQNRLSNVFFYHNDKLLNNDSREELKISAVLKSDEGFYKCQHSGKESPRSWISVRVTVSSPASYLFLVLLIVGLVVKIVLFLLLLLFLCCRRNNEAGEPRAPVYSMIELRNFRKNCSTPTYANINYHKKWKGKRSPAATDGVYSEISM